MRLESEKLELTGSLCSMQQKLTGLETVVQELEDERVTVVLLDYSELTNLYSHKNLYSFEC